MTLKILAETERALLIRVCYVRGMGEQPLTAEYMTPEEVARRLGINGNKVRAWIASGRLQASDIALRDGGRRPRWRVSQAALDAFLKSRSNRPPAKVSRRQREESLPTLRDLLEQPGADMSRHSLQA